MYKVCTIIGTRPEIIRTSCILQKLDKHCHHIIVHTNQNFTANLKDMFFDDLGLRKPDICLDDGTKDGWNSIAHTTKGLGQQLAYMFPQIEQVFKDEKPDRVFILGDTNSALCSIIAERMGIPVYHMEAGNRSYDKKIPEEVNRHLIDAISSYNLTYTQTSKEALLREGCSSKKIFLCGNPTLEVLTFYDKKISSSTVLDQLNLTDAGYFLCDFHRTENTTSERLTEIINGLNLVAEDLKKPVICSIHPRTKDRLKDLNYNLRKEIKFLDAVGFFDFVKLEKHAAVGLTDSGLVSEELNILHTPCVIIRDTTERPEVVEAGSAIISGVKSWKILENTKMMIGKTGWKTPEGWGDYNVSDKVVNYILGEAQ